MGKIFAHLPSELRLQSAAGRQPVAAPEVAVIWRKEGRGLLLSVELRHPALSAPLVTTLEASGSGHLVLRWPGDLSNTKDE